MMNLKTFTGRNMQETLTLVQRALGDDATVLHTRSYRRGGILGFGATTVVEITAADAATMKHSRAQRQQAHGSRGNTASSRPTSPRVAPGTTTTRAGAGTPQLPSQSTSATAVPPASAALTSATTIDHNASAGDLIRRTYAAAMAEMSKQQAQRSPSSATTAVAPQEAWVMPGSPSSTSRAGSTTPAESSRLMANGASSLTPPSVTIAPIATGTDQLAQEMMATQRMVAQMMRRQRTGEAGPTTNADLPASLFDQYLALLKQEVAEELAEEILAEVKAGLKSGELSDAARVNAAVAVAIARHLPVDEDAGKLLPTGDKRPRTIALIGPTGVGKTTTIAKLAASFKLKQKKSVGLITLDTYRIAAVEQLRTYTQIIGVPLRVASNVDELLAALRQCQAQRCDVVLIDTAGRSQHDDPRLEQLASLIQAADPHEVHLVLSSTCAQNVLLETAQRFARIRTDRIIFTKLDEAVSFGVLLNVARKVNKRLSFITTGQEVPHHIEPSQAQRLAALVMGQGVVRC